MTVAEVIRQQTLSARDRLAGLDQRISETEAVRNAAEERVKRASTEITRQRTLETERKRSLGLAAEKVEEAQRILDELERKRQEALDVFMRLQEEQTSVAHSLRNAQGATEAALTETRKEQKAKQDADAELARIRTDRIEGTNAFRRSMLKALDIYLEQQAGTLQAAFSTQEQRSKSLREVESFRKARHTDAEIGRLCDERDEIRKLLSNAMVPGVKTMLQDSLKLIEESLIKRFPTALGVPDTVPNPNDNRIEELLFYRDTEGKALFILPVHPADWDAAQETCISETTTKNMCLVWNMIKELNLRTEDGDFVTVQGRPVFASRFDLEEVAILQQGFAVKCEGTDVIRFVLATVPTELQEALYHEDQDN
jgi:hypothetical protein